MILFSTVIGHVKQGGDLSGLLSCDVAPQAKLDAYIVFFNLDDFRLHDTHRKFIHPCLFRSL